MAEKGSLVVFVYTARMAIPIKNARVSILRANSNELLGFRVTNDEGLTDVYEETTPDTAISLTPQPTESEFVSPFSVVDLQIEHPMYQKILIEDVQIFSNLKSIQNVELIPLEEYSTTQTSSETFIITPQNL